MRDSAEERLEEVRRLMALPERTYDLNDTEPISGVVISLTEAESEYGVYPVVKLANDYEVIVVHAQRTALKEQILSNDVRAGDALGIQYLGEVAKKNGKGTYHRYRVVHAPALRVEDQDRVPATTGERDEEDSF